MAGLSDDILYDMLRFGSFTFFSSLHETKQLVDFIVSDGTLSLERLRR